MKTLLTVVAAVFLVSPSVLADQVTLKNGDRLSGDIVRSDDKTLTIKSEFAGEVTLQWAAVDTITSTQTLHVTLKDGQTIVGTATPVAGPAGSVTGPVTNREQIQTRDAGPVVTTKDAIVAIRSDKEQAAYDAELDRLKHPHLTDYWGGFLDAGLSTTRGNSDTLSFVLGAKAVRAAPGDKVTVYGNSIFAKSSATGPSLTTAHSINGGIRVDVNLKPRLFAFGFTDFEYDQFQKLNLRNVLGGGLGFHVLKTQRTVFDAFGGGSYDQAYYSTGVNIKGAEIVVGEDFSYQMSNRTALSENLQFFPNVSHSGQYRTTFDTTLTTKINNWLNWQASFNDHYVSNPIPGIKKNDLLLTTGVRLTYGKGGV